MSVRPPRNEKHFKVRLYFIQESNSGKAWQFVFAPRKELAGDQFVWLPVSMIWRALKNPVKDGEHYPMYELTLPDWLVTQKNLKDHILSEQRA